MLRELSSHMPKPIFTVSQKKVKKVTASNSNSNQPTSISSDGSSNLVGPLQTTENETLTIRRRPSLGADKTTTGTSSGTSSNRTGASYQTPTTRAIVTLASKPKSKPPVPAAGNNSLSTQQL